MKIVPLVDESGLCWQVRKWTFFGTKALGLGGSWIGEGNFVDWRISAMRFETPKAAAQEIRKQFGKRAQIKTWVGK